MLADPRGRRLTAVAMASGAVSGVDDHLEQRHPVDGREEVHAQDPAPAAASPVAISPMGIDEVLLAKTQLVGGGGLDLGEHAPLQLEVLEHRLDDEVGPPEARVVEGGREALHPLVDLERVRRPALPPLLDRSRARSARPRPRASCDASLSRTRTPTSAGDAGDARAHEAGAEHAELRRPRSPSCPRGSPRPS